MESYKSGSHTVWDCKYHLVWTTKYRYQVLGGDIGLRCRELLREIARSKEMLIYAGSINRVHVHMQIGIPPQLSVSKAVQYLKGKSSHRLLTEFPALRKRVKRRVVDAPQKIAPHLATKPLRNRRRLPLKSRRGKAHTGLGS